MQLSIIFSIWVLLGIIQIRFHSDWIVKHIKELNWRHDSRLITAIYTIFFIVLAPFLLFYITIPRIFSRIKVWVFMFIIKRKANNFLKSKGIKERI